ncbi:hypothetical protein GCM10023201_14930 [Actinomycetospora corticicola]|uniref:Uncharacterized protein n=1 Tax=Actinomycetospora corticicola TaxID=663602 RepID=A0A7Y9DV80_9PSEU|nr:hypothetical protein [Actinomycetospora corticicola]NYD36147.1 hypothetical protein [Actinomycetospora corticicola]
MYVDVDDVQGARLREYLYADVDRTQSLLAQLLGSVPSSESGTTTRSRKLGAGLRGYAAYDSERKTEQKEERTRLDALFPELEDLLEASGWLTDISDILADTKSTDYGAVLKAVQPGSIVRLRAPGLLFDASYVAKVMAGSSVAIKGAHEVSPQGPDASDNLSFNSAGGKGKAGSGSKGKSQPAEGSLEAQIEHFDASLLGGFSPEMMRGLVRTSRGLFPDGLYMLVEATGAAKWTATVRLQRDRRYLDAEPEVLFSRYGTTPQNWVIVGTLGHFSNMTGLAGFSPVSNLTTTTGINRPAFVKFLNDFLAALGGSGMADTPPFPGFSLVPFGIYREIPKPS